MKVYTGIGSRNTPKDILTTMTDISSYLDYNGYTLRSGGADGADTAFENGSKNKEIYLPWKKFNNNMSPLYDLQNDIHAMEIAKDIHPYWNNLKNSVRKLHMRNVYQVLGHDLNNPSEFLICWTRDGKTVGGTATAIKLAEKLNIPVFNLCTNYDINKLTKLISSI